MLRGSSALLCCLILMGAEAASAQPKTAKGMKYRDCDALCADLNAAIQKHPERLGMWLEDALVIHEDCVGQIVSAAMDAVGNEPEAVRAIQETTLHVAPHRAHEIRLAMQRFKIPTALVWTEPEPQEEVRRAVMPGEAIPPAAEVEIRRALTPGTTQPTPIEEVRRAVVIIPDPSLKLNRTAPAKVATTRRPRR